MSNIKRYKCINGKGWKRFTEGKIYSTNENGVLLNDKGTPLNNALKDYPEDFELVEDTTAKKRRYKCVNDNQWERFVEGGIYETNEDGHLINMDGKVCVFALSKYPEDFEVVGEAGDWKVEPMEVSEITYKTEECDAEVTIEVEYGASENMNLPTKRHEPSERVMEHFEREHAIEEARQNTVEVDPEEERIRKASEGLTLFVGDI